LEVADTSVTQAASELLGPVGLDAGNTPVIARESAKGPLLIFGPAQAR
jgi:hypothetical protein